MLFRSFLPLALLACSSTAAPIEKRQRQTDFQIVSGVLNGIIQGVKRTERDISQWRGDQKGANLVLDDSEYLYRDILEGTQIVGRTNTVSNWDSPSMLAPANALNSALDGLVTSLIKKKSQIDKINYTPVVRSQLLKLRDSADGLTKSFFSKLPIAAAAVARPVSSLITAKLDKGINAFPLPSGGSGGFWPFGGQSGAPPAPTISGPSPYRNDPLPPYPSSPQQPQSPYTQSPPPTYTQSGPQWGSQPQGSQPGPGGPSWAGKSV